MRTGAQLSSALAGRFLSRRCYISGGWQAAALQRVHWGAAASALAEEVAALGASRAFIIASQAATATHVWPSRSPLLPALLANRRCEAEPESRQRMATAHHYSRPSSPIDAAKPHRKVASEWQPLTPTPGTPRQQTLRSGTDEIAKCEAALGANHAGTWSGMRGECSDVAMVRVSGNPIQP